jgi:hypothetical protein
MSLATKHFRRQIYLALGFLALAGPAAAQVCTSPVPATWTNRVETSSGSLHITLATLQYNYLPGQPVAMKLHIQNVGAAPVFIPNPYQISPIEVFGVVADSCDSLSQPDCVEVFHFPQVYFFFGAGFTLQPGQCREFDRTWNGLTGGPPAPPPDGIYAIISGIQAGDESDPDGLDPPSGGIRLNIRIQGAVPVQPATWSEIKTRID